MGRQLNKLDMALRKDFDAVRSIWMARPRVGVLLDFIEQFDQYLVEGEEEAQDATTNWGLRSEPESSSGGSRA
jgi:BMFP domain-containing protein YqiC